VICSKFVKPAHKIEDAVTDFLKEYKDCVILITVDSKLDVEGHTFGDRELIEIELNSKSPNVLLTLAHELVHAKQILEGEPKLESEAYAKEQEVYEFLKNSLAI
jgi:hypothetical protein